jgi:hypothetical protein
MFTRHRRLLQSYAVTPADLAAYPVADTVSVLAGYLCRLWWEQGGRPKTYALP